MKCSTMTIRLSALSIAAFVAAACAQTMGAKPEYLQELASGFPNEKAIVQRIWVPGLDEGFVPQGLAIEGDHLLVAAYRSADPKVNTGPCRVVRIEAATGKIDGSFDMPPAACGHAGGLAYLGNGVLLLADTRALYRIDLARALAVGQAEGAITGSVKLSGELRGSYAAFDGRHAWIGTWTKEPAKSRMYRLDARLFDDYDGKTVNESRATASVPVPLEAQGAAFDKDGNIWISASNSHWGKLYRLDRGTGEVRAMREMVAGVEDLAFDSAGRLWAVSESGSKKYAHWKAHFPFVFAIDPAKLE
jgi:DNA-binding beta-propeller fold protein YncE